MAVQKHGRSGENSPCIVVGLYPFLAKGQGAVKIHANFLTLVPFHHIRVLPMPAETGQISCDERKGVGNRQEEDNRILLEAKEIKKRSKTNRMQGNLYARF